MPMQIKLLAIVPSDQYHRAGYIAYFFHKDTQTLLPIPISTLTVEALILKINAIKLPRPPVYDTIRRLLLPLKGKVTYIQIYLFQDDLFYAYICINNGNKTYKVDASLGDALCMAAHFEVPIFATEQVLQTGGVFVTKSMVRKALGN